MKKRPNSKMVLTLFVLIAALLGAAGYYYWEKSNAPSNEDKSITAGKVEEDLLVLNAKQVQEVAPKPMEQTVFQTERTAVGNIDFDQTSSVQVFSPNQGKIGKVLVNAGDDVTKGQILFTVFVPDIAQAASNLISAAGVLKNANETLRRAQTLIETKSISQKEFDQNISDQQAAEASFKAAKVSILLFGVDESDIETIISTKKVDIEMPVRSPISGRVIARNASTGLLVQPGNTPAPFILANLRKMWLLANVPEAEIADYKSGQSITMKVSAYPDKEFKGAIRYVGDSSDPVTHRVLVRSEVDDPDHLLRAQMLADFTIKVSNPRTAFYLPIDAITRENDGSLIAWVQKDPTHFKRVKVKTGSTQNNLVEITEGLSNGDVVATQKSLFLDNLYTLTSN